MKLDKLLAVLERAPSPSFKLEAVRVDAQLLAYARSAQGINAMLEFARSNSAESALQDAHEFIERQVAKAEPVWLLIPTPTSRTFDRLRERFDPREWAATRIVEAIGFGPTFSIPGDATGAHQLELVQLFTESGADLFLEITALRDRVAELDRTCDHLRQRAQEKQIAAQAAQHERDQVLTRCRGLRDALDAAIGGAT